MAANGAMSDETESDEGEGAEGESGEQDGGSTGEPSGHGGASAEPDDRPGKGEPGSRDKRRFDRLRETKAAAKAAEARAAAVERANADLQRQVAELSGRVSEREARGRDTDSGNELRDKVRKLRADGEAQLVLANSLGEKNPAAARAAMDKYYDIQEQIDDVRDEARWSKRSREIAGSMPNPALAAQASALAGEFKWLTDNPEARITADGRIQALVASGKPTNMATWREACAWTARALNLGGHTPPTDANKRRYEGRGAGEGESASGDKGGGMSVDDVKNNLAYKRMAVQTFPQLEPEAAMAKWAKEVGAKLSSQ